MQKVRREVQFSSEVSESTDVNEFIIEFYCEDQDQSSPIVTRNFDELIDLFDELDQ